MIEPGSRTVAAMHPALWWSIPLLGGLIGYLTNWLAVRMVFRPIRPRRVLGLRVQGLVGRRQPELARSIGDVVGRHLVQRKDVLECFEKADLEAALARVLGDALRPKLDELRRVPLIGNLLTDTRRADLQAALVDGLMKHRELAYASLEEALESGLDVERLVAEKVAAFPVEKLETLVLSVAGKELRAIEIWGGVLGFCVGLGQVLLIWSLS
jgi:uncharacterized membrane protein YheB (UPF0754 family)